MRLVAMMAVGLVLLPLGVLAQDAAMGEQLFSRCAMCHEIGEGAVNRQGPVLTGIVGRRAASVPGFPYSEALKQAGAGGLIWTPEALAAFIAKPKHFEPGTGMIFPGLDNANDAADVVAYLTARAATDNAAVAAGAALLEANCGGCHAIGATGPSPHDEAPPFRELHQRYDVEDLTEALVEGLVSGHPDMPEFKFDPDQANAIVRYLKSLE